MRFVFLLATACGGMTYDTASRLDTIEAYEEFLKANPGSSMQNPAEKRLEELYFAKATSDGTPEAWEAYLARFPEGGANYPQALKAASAAAWNQAFADGSEEALKAFLDKYGKGDKVYAERARGLLAAKQYGKLEISAPRIEKVNMAEDPKGELNGWGVFVDVTNAGDQTFDYVRLTVDWAGADGKDYGSRDYPLTAQRWAMPATEEQQTPLKPGEKRVWSWTESFGKIPADAQLTAKVYPSGLTAAKKP